MNDTNDLHNGQAKVLALAAVARTWPTEGHRYEKPSEINHFLRCCTFQHDSYKSYLSLNYAKYDLIGVMREMRRRILRIQEIIRLL